MNKFLYVIIPAALLLSCSSSQDTFKKTNNNAEKMEKESPTKQNSRFSCNVELIDNQIPSNADKDFYYAIVSLRVDKEKFQNNWRIVLFEINGEIFEEFDDFALKGKDHAIYRNNVREISRDLEAPYSVKIQFENDNGEKTEFELDDVQLTTVH